jgi:hypothetical protein
VVLMTLFFVPYVKKDHVYSSCWIVSNPVNRLIPFKVW